jgi:hypothetical protein
MRSLSSQGYADMKAALLFVLLASPAFAQNKFADTAIAPSCGADDAKFDVKTLKRQHPVSQLDAEKALVYFIEDDSNYNSFFKPTTRAGLDGAWVGATHGSSYFYFSVAPGEHHLCASWQPIDARQKSRTKALAHFTAEAGRIYFFRVKNHWNGNYGAVDINFEPLDSDEGRLLESTFSFSTFHPRK